ncbi:hypothetical protein, partial [Bacillus sp. WP8]|uniref:hypothetical protein n=1 Tax=Bacillus sp. WP8 TaxID=756828 RepID=UPI00119F1C4E
MAVAMVDGNKCRSEVKGWVNILREVAFIGCERICMGVGVVVGRMIVADLCEKGVCWVNVREYVIKAFFFN